MFFSFIYVKFLGKSRDGSRGWGRVRVGVLLGLWLGLGLGFEGVFKTFIMNFEV